MSKIAAASNGHAAVAVIATISGPVVLRYAPRPVGQWDHREEFDALAERAAAKLGYKRDRRCKGGWRKQS